MADQAYEFNVNAIDWTARDTAWKPADGDKWWFYNHPDYDGLVYLYGDGTNVTGSLDIYADPWQNGVILTQGRIYSKELITSFTSTGWVTVAETDSGNTAESISGRFTASSSTGGENIVVDYNVRPDASSMSHERSSINIESLSKSSSGGAVIFKGARFAYYDSTSGVKLQIYVASSPSTLTTNISNNVTRLSSYEGLKLVTPTTTNNDKTPDGSTASFLVAGDELLEVNKTLTFQDQRISCIATTSTSLRVTILFDNIPYPAATTVTFPVGFPFRETDGTTIYTVTASDTMSISSINGNAVTGIISTTGLTAPQMGFAVGSNISVVLS